MILPSNTIVAVAGWERPRLFRDTGEIETSIGRA